MRSSPDVYQQRPKLQIASVQQPLPHALTKSHTSINLSLYQRTRSATYFNSNYYLSYSYYKIMLYKKHFFVWFEQTHFEQLIAHHNASHSTHTSQFCQIKPITTTCLAYHNSGMIFCLFTF